MPPHVIDQATQVYVQDQGGRYVVGRLSTTSTRTFPDYSAAGQAAAALSAYLTRAGLTQGTNLQAIANATRDFWRTWSQQVVVLGDTAARAAPSASGKALALGVLAAIGLGLASRRPRRR